MRPPERTGAWRSLRLGRVQEVYGVTESFIAYSQGFRLYKIILVPKLLKGFVSLGIDLSDLPFQSVTKSCYFLPLKCNFGLPWWRSG